MGLNNSSGLRSGKQSSTTPHQHRETPQFASAGEAMFSAQFRGEVWTGDEKDPVVFHRSYFPDNEYRVIIIRPNTNETPLYRTPDFSSWTEITADLLPTEPSGGGSNFQDQVRLPNGIWVLYRSVNDDYTDIYTSPDLRTLTRQGTVLPDTADAGAVLDQATDTIHIYTEAATGTGPTSSILEHHTTSTDDLLTSTQHSNAIDVSNRSWSTGDPDFVQVGGTYYMFHDRTAPEHTNYYIAVSRSDDLYNWTMLTDQLTTVYGGDMAATRRNGTLEALTEFSGADTQGVGHWTLTPHLSDRQIILNTRSTHVPDADVGENQTALYVNNGTIYAKQRGMSPVALSSEGGTTGLLAISTIVDDFESDLSSYSGDIADATIQTTDVQVGTQALELTESAGGFTGIASVSGLNAYPTQGDTFRLWLRTSANEADRTQLGWAAQSATNRPDRYFVQLSSDVDELRLQRRDGDTNTQIGGTPQPIDTTTWYQLQVEWGADGSISGTLYNATGTQLSQVEATDETFIDGGIHFGQAVASGSATSAYDHFGIVE